MIPDVAILGAGINGAGLFRDLCAQRVHCLIVDNADFGSGTSAARSRPHHGGLAGSRFQRWLIAPGARVLAPLAALVHPVRHSFRLSVEHRVQRFLDRTANHLAEEIPDPRFVDLDCLAIGFISGFSSIRSESQPARYEHSTFFPCYSRREGTAKTS